MASNFSRLLDELAELSKERDKELLQKYLDEEAARQRKKAAAKATADKEVSDMVANSAKLSKERAAEAKAKKQKLADDAKKAAESEIAARNAARANVSNVLAKALELNRLGKITAVDVARIEISANEALARIK